MVSSILVLLCHYYEKTLTIVLLRILLHFYVTAIVILLAYAIESPKDTPSAIADIEIVGPLLENIGQLAENSSTSCQDIRQSYSYCDKLFQEAREIHTAAVRRPSNDQEDFLAAQTTLSFQETEQFRQQEQQQQQLQHEINAPFRQIPLQITHNNNPSTAQTGTATSPWEYIDISATEIPDMVQWE